MCCIYSSYEAYVGSLWDFLTLSQQVLYPIINAAYSSAGSILASFSSNVVGGEIKVKKPSSVM